LFQAFRLQMKLERVPSLAERKPHRAPRRVKLLSRALSRSTFEGAQAHGAAQSISQNASAGGFKRGTRSRWRDTKLVPVLLACER
jgi:hypothetical protein